MTDPKYHFYYPQYTKEGSDWDTHRIIRCFECGSIIVLGDFESENDREYFMSLHIRFHEYINALIHGQNLP